MNTTKAHIPEHAVSDLLVAKAARHATLLQADEAAIRSVHCRTLSVASGEDIVRQGDRPQVAVFVVSGMLARYHTLQGGERQYLSLHIAGDMPDVQGLLLEVMDHSLCAMGQADIAVFPHDQLCQLLLKRPGVSFAFWRLTLVDAAIFRQAITNNSARSHVARLAHLFCEQYYRAREAKLADGRTCRLPLTQAQLGQALGMSHISVNRALQALRKAGLVELRAATLQIINWSGLRRAAGFDPTYLHVARTAEISRTAFSSRRT